MEKRKHYLRVRLLKMLHDKLNYNLANFNVAESLI